MKRLYAPSPAPDVRAALLSVWVGLLLLLLPFLLITTSPDKLTAIDLHLSGGGGAPSPARVLESVEVRVEGADLEVRAAVRKTDVLAAAGDVEMRVVEIPGAEDPDFVALQDTLARLRALDPAQTRIRVIPDDALSTADLVQVLDAVRARGNDPLFPDVELAEAAAP